MDAVRIQVLQSPELIPLPGVLYEKIKKQDNIMTKNFELIWYGVPLHDAKAGAARVRRG
jgi:hypothetical protein